jgi:hypothetical protein
LRHRQMLLRILPLKIIFNGNQIYDFREKQPVIYNPQSTITTLVVTNGFHNSRTVMVNTKPGTWFYEVECMFDDIQVITGTIITGYRFFMIFANLPALIFLFLFYFKRKEFIRVHTLKPHKQIRH